MKEFLYFIENEIEGDTWVGASFIAGMIGLFFSIVTLVIGMIIIWPWTGAIVTVTIVALFVFVIPYGKYRSIGNQKR